MAGRKINTVYTSCYQIPPGLLMSSVPLPVENDAPSSEPPNSPFVADHHARNEFSVSSFTTSVSESVVDVESVRMIMDDTHFSTQTSSVDRGSHSTSHTLYGSAMEENHVNFVLMYDMLTGIRHSVSACQAKPAHVISDKDFSYARTYFSPIYLFLGITFCQIPASRPHQSSSLDLRTIVLGFFDLSEKRSMLMLRIT